MFFSFIYIRNMKEKKRYFNAKKEAKKLTDTKFNL